MKCGTFVRRVEKKRKKKHGGFTFRTVVARWVSLWNLKVEGWTLDQIPITAYGPVPPTSFIPKEEFEECDGEIIAKIEVIDEATWGGHYASLQIDYTCNKCGSAHFSELPQDEESLSKLVTEAIAKISKKQRTEVFAEGLKQKQEMAKRMKEMQQETLARKQLVLEKRKKKANKKK